MLIPVQVTNGALWSDVQGAPPAEGAELQRSHFLLCASLKHAPLPKEEQTQNKNMVLVQKNSTRAACM